MALIRFYESKFSGKYTGNYLKYLNNDEVFLWLRLCIDLVKLFYWIIT